MGSVEQVALACFGVTSSDEEAAIAAARTAFLKWVIEFFLGEASKQDPFGDVTYGMGGYTPLTLMQARIPS
ncbi:hypothetical protein LF95_14790 [Thalassospira sp. TSL5-1]|nr:hypothetical protein LF95_14790 [Thalassospira sp. TSL5-1]